MRHLNVRIHNRNDLPKIGHSKLTAKLEKKYTYMLYTSCIFKSDAILIELRILEIWKYLKLGRKLGVPLIGRARYTLHILQ